MSVFPPGPQARCGQRPGLSGSHGTPQPGALPGMPVPDSATSSQSSHYPRAAASSPRTHTPQTAISRRCGQPPQASTWGLQSDVTGDRWPRDLQGPDKIRSLDPSTVSHLSNLCSPKLFLKHFPTSQKDCEWPCTISHLKQQMFGIHSTCLLNP